MRILNPEALTSHGNRAGREAMVRILEAGLQAADPYYSIKRLVRMEGDRLTLDCADFVGEGFPTDAEVIDLAEIDRILVVGAGKGVQRMGLALEELLGDRISGGHLIAKHGDGLILTRIGVTHGAHPAPDQGCVLGCKRILKALEGVTERDLVFTLVSNGVSSLLTLPAPGVSLEDIHRVTRLLQIERGTPTGDLNPIRNHLDQLKGGRLSRFIHPARAVHIYAFMPWSRERILHHNVWLHTLPGGSTYATAIANLKRWEAWDEAPSSVRDYLTRADPATETVKPDEFLRMRSSVYGIMPTHLGMVPAARAEAEAMGFGTAWLAEEYRIEASQAGFVAARIAHQIAAHGQPWEPPYALFTCGEQVVTVGAHGGMGGRNQEHALSAAIQIAGNPNIVIGSVDSDGTDGPGHQYVEGLDAIPVLNGGIVDGETAIRAAERGIDLEVELRHHNASPALWALGCGVQATPNISMNDLSVALVLGRNG